MMMKQCSRDRAGGATFHWLSNAIGWLENHTFLLPLMAPKSVVVWVLWGIGRSNFQSLLPPADGIPYHTLYTTQKLRVFRFALFQITVMSGHRRTGPIVAEVQGFHIQEVCTYGHIYLDPLFSPLILFDGHVIYLVLCLLHHKGSTMSMVYIPGILPLDPPFPDWSARFDGQGIYLVYTAPEGWNMYLWYIPDIYYH